MLFTTITFWYFFAITLLLIYLFNGIKIRKVILFTASCYFYYYSSSLFLSVLLAIGLLAYLFALIIQNSAKFKKLSLVIAILINLGTLIYYKYLGFFFKIGEQIGFNLGLSQNFTGIAVPLAISFYTFEVVSYLVDVYVQKIEAEKSILDFYIFLFFFPKLISGPIIRANDFLPQLKKNINLNFDNFKIGFSLFIIGLIKKMIFADNLSPLVDYVFKDPFLFSTTTILIGSLAFLVQIYCDFSGYSDMAIGVAKIMGFEIPQNFTRPYLSENISEFWRKWHISLSSWVKDYIFIPLSQKLSLIQSKLNYDLKLKTMINVLLAQFVAIFLIGIWHGANWNFLIFSIYNGTFVVGYYLFLQFRKKIGIYKKVPLGSVMSKLLTLYVIMIGFLSFRIQDLNILLFSIKKLTFSITFSFKELLDILSKHRPSLIFLLIFTLVYLYYCKSDSNFSDKLVKLSVAYWSFVVLAGIFACLLLKPTIAQSFIYFQF